MEATTSTILNFVALAIAIFGVYISAARDYEQKRDEANLLRRQLDDCWRENARLREQEFVRARGGINVSGGAVTFGRDAIGGDERKRDEYDAGNDVNTRK